MSARLSLHLSPFVPVPLLAACGVAALVFCALLLWRRAPGWGWRIGALALLLAALANPVAEHAQLQGVPDIALLAVDDSASQNLPPRRDQIKALLPALRRKIQALPDLELREIHVDGRDTTLLGGAIVSALADIAPERRAGVIAVTDGQIHDADALTPPIMRNTPLHLLLTGKRDEFDRRIAMIEAPRYGLVGQNAEASFRVIDQPKAQGDGARVILHGPDGDQLLTAQTGEETRVSLPVAHAGDNIFILEAAPAEGELTDINNRAVIRVQGIRERLRVLLVSGEPHPGERVWRNLLKSDPAVDLVHFTILRTPLKMDATPPQELSLIVFPVRELFEEKLRSFDLVIFDRFRKQGMLPMDYLGNIAAYVEAGGAFLDASGPSYVTNESLDRTPLARILPAKPETVLLEKKFVPQVTAAGKTHPVTAFMNGAGAWGPWYRQSAVEAARGQILMTGADGAPLLILDRAGKGRVAQIASDQLWLWARGHEGGGPHTELMRRIAHWLMKEPELEEDLLRLNVTTEAEGYKLHIERPGAQPAEDSVTLIAPGGAEQQKRLMPAQDKAQANINIAEPGVWRARHGGKEQSVIVGNTDAKEFQDMRATDSLLRPAVEAGDGGVFWLDAHPDGPEIKRTATHGSQAGRDWLGLRRNDQNIVTGAQAEDLLPPWAWAALILAAVMLGWRREGR